MSAYPTLSGNVYALSPVNAGYPTRAAAVLSSRRINPQAFYLHPLTEIVDPGNVNSPALTVQPNPAHDVLVIKHPASARMATLRFMDIMGRTAKLIEPAGQATQTITSVQGLMAGIYTIVWTDGSRTLSRVVIVQ